MIEQLQYEYEKRIKSLEEKCERQRVQIESLTLLQVKNRNTIAKLKAERPDGQFFKVCRDNIEQIIGDAQDLLDRVDRWKMRCQEE